MDWRNRKYYLVTLGYGVPHHGRIQRLKRISSVKLSKPYQHILSPIENTTSKYLDSINYDGFHRDKTGLGYVQYMLGCNTDVSESVEKLLNAFPDSLYCYWFELTKEICGQ